MSCWCARLGLPAAKQDGADLLWGEDAMQLPVYAWNDAEYMEQVKASQKALAEFAAMVGGDEERWRAYVQLTRASLLADANY